MDLKKSPELRLLIAFHNNFQSTDLSPKARFKSDKILILVHVRIKSRVIFRRDKSLVDVLFKITGKKGRYYFGPILCTWLKYDSIAFFIGKGNETNVHIFERGA